MAEHVAAVAAAMRFGTGSHFDETLAARGGGVPSQCRWRDIHPPGVRVLPRGSPPAGAGEVNWEDTLGGQYALAWKRLEGLLYTVFGSRPAAYDDGASGWHVVQYWDRVHPRCLWGPEVLTRDCYAAGTGCASGGLCNGNCVETTAWGEYAALGDSGGLGYPQPAVPIRPRSADPTEQFAAATHGAVFPRGSVSRDNSAFPYSPHGRGWFGATQPGRNDTIANPWLTSANGYTEDTGEDVIATWVKPGAAATPTAIELRYSLRAPGGSWSAYTAVTLTGGPTYTATIPKQDHGTECRWYLRYWYDAPGGAADDVEQFDPGGATEPAASSQYSFTWFTHFNPYEHGAPELLDDYGGVDVRHGTDGYLFDGSETIQPELLNLGRSIVAILCGTSCQWQDSACDDDADGGHPGQFHVSPRQRPAGDDGLCCAPWPIRFYWSGGNEYPHAIRGGKGDDADPLDTRPLTNAWNTPNLGAIASRMTWAGIENLFGATPLANHEYGGGPSWGVAPFAQRVQFDGTEDARAYATWPAFGLRAGMVIEAVHIREFIDAVDYLVRYGMWLADPIKTCKTKATGLDGYTCGYWSRQVRSGPQARNPNVDCAWYCGWNSATCAGCGYEDDTTQLAPCANCCAPTSNCPDPICNWTDYDRVQLTIDPFDCDAPVTVTDSIDTTAGVHCDDWATPTWEECWAQESPCSAGVCSMTLYRWRACTATGVQPNAPAVACAGSEEHVQMACGAPPTSCGPITDPVGDCGSFACSETCTWRDFWADELISCTAEDSIGGNPTAPCAARGETAIHGLSYRYCTGPACRDGWDDAHGNGVKKHRADHTWHNPDFWQVATGPPGNESAGNCYGDIVVCGTLEAAAHPNATFQEVRKVDFHGQASPWTLANCSCDPSPLTCPHVPSLSLPPPLPGLGHHTSAGDPLCAQEGLSLSPLNLETSTSCECDISDWGPCRGESAWAAIDLNIDGSGRPYVTYAGLDGDLEPYAGDAVPRLRPYDLGLDPATWMHDCPCETWTGAALC